MQSVHILYIVCIVVGIFSTQTKAVGYLELFEHKRVNGKMTGDDNWWNEENAGEFTPFKPPTMASDIQQTCPLCSSSYIVFLHSQLP